MRLDFLEVTWLALLFVGLFSLYVRRPRENRSSWPTWVLVPIALFISLPMGLAMPDPLRPFRFIIFAIVLSRWSAALLLRERSRGWMFYLAVLLAAV